MQTTTVRPATAPPSRPPKAETGHVTSGRADRADATASASHGRLTLDLYDRMDAIEPLWRAMQRERLCPIHQTFDWCAAWVAAKAPPLALIVGRLDGEDAFVLPLEIVRSGPFRIARFIASPFSNLNAGVFSAHFDRSESAMREFLPMLRSALVRLKVCDCVLFDRLPAEWQGGANPLAGLPRSENQNRSFQVTLHERFEDVLAQTNAKRRRKKFRVSTRRMEAHGGYEHVIAETPQEAATLLEAFFRQKAARFESQGLADVFSEPSVQAFFERLTACSTSNDASADTRGVPLQLHGIRLKGENAGAYCAISSLSMKDDRVICQFGAIDDTLAADASPGELLFYLMIEKACKDGFSVFDFGIGDQPYKRSWCDVETVHYDVVIATTAMGRLFAAAHRSTVAAKRFVKHNPRALRLARRVRRLTSRRAAGSGQAA